MQAYLFDFDGTIVDSAPDLTRALDLALSKAGLPGVGLELGKQMAGHGAGKLVGGLCDTLLKMSTSPWNPAVSPLVVCIL